jgi:hypothetical protein
LVNPSNQFSVSGGTMRVMLTAVLIFASLSSTPSLSAQQSTPAPTSDPQAVALIQRALAALVGRATVSDVTLTGTAQRIAGSDEETGTSTLTAMSVGNSKLSLSFPSAVSSEIRNSAGTPLSETSTTQGPQPVGAWSGPDGVLHATAEHNLMTDASWFFPAFTINDVSASQSFVLSYIGSETHNGLSALHVTAWRTFPGFTQAPPLLSHLTQMDLYLDPASCMPVALDFNIHPDNNATLDIPVEIRFSGYQPVNGVQVPFHVQKYLNNGLVLDLQFNNAVLNSGLTAASFQIQ